MKFKVGDVLRHRYHHEIAGLGTVEKEEDADGYLSVKTEKLLNKVNWSPEYCTLVKQEATPAPAPKPANPKKAYGDKKPPLHLIHNIAELHESTALHSGRLKYGENNFIETPVEIMTYIGAILRHTKQYASGERVDRKELVHHLGAVKACCTILLTAEACGTLVDNRPETLAHPKHVEKGSVDYQTATSNTFDEVERIIEHLNKLYPQE